MLMALVTSAGRRVGLLETLRDDARDLGLSLSLLAADSSPGLSAACSLADRSFQVPPCTSRDYLAALATICKDYNVRVVIPTIDTELPVLASGASLIAQSGARACISSIDAIAIARDKLVTFRVLSAAGIPAPQTFVLEDVLQGRETISGAIVLKPLGGSRSVGIVYAEGVEQARSQSLDALNYVAQERLVGSEYTVNCFVDQSGALRAAVPHRRLEVRAGEVNKGITERRTDLTEVAHSIVRAVPGLRGPFCFQAILTANGPKVFEINARFGGGYPLAHAAGATFGKWIMEEALGLPCTANDKWEDGLLMLRYDSAVYTKTKAAP